MINAGKEYYTLTYNAKFDVDGIFDYDEDRFGIDQALKYFFGLESLFEQLTTFPNEGILRNDIGSGIRSIPYGSHLVFYLITDISIEIVRILHQSQNTMDYFE
ncbi:type II toxin-antitoxin system RelE/ParE family toxin [Aequorivita capsosiphonis]|uniref:type II toxin-antitoxin system RelE/ParE family toxin n=1 Tax=Aequorivita capsosiphonis TaxID=487317 RepID=UPI0003F608C8|nr:type II toxin-antitoxin system RelE/ParE family toxin [Aequorivita capsosiphonis]